MARNASPRMVVFKHFRRQPKRAILILRITEGPRTELGKDVHLVLTKVDLPVLREIVRAVEDQEDA